MDQFCVDISEIDGVSEGDEVVLFGKELRAGELARLSDTIHYEIICGISKRVPRIIKKG
jgi:alanine racemase